jgi:hypothetical protein
MLTNRVILICVVSGSNLLISSLQTMFLDSPHISDQRIQIGLSGGDITLAAGHTHCLQLIYKCRCILLIRES